MMPVTRIDIREVSARWSEIVSLVAEGSEVIVTEGDIPRAKLDDQFTNRCAAAIGLGKTGRLRQAGKPPGSRGQGCPSCQTPLRRRLSWTSKHKIDCRLSTEPTPRRKPWSFAVG